jgi:hypothetical protein
VSPTGHRAQIAQRVEQVHASLLRHVRDGGQLAIVKAPPGSGKTYLLLRAVDAIAREARVAVAAQTNSQADDVCHRIARDYPELRCVRFAASSAVRPDDLPDSVEWVTASSGIPHDPCVVVGTTSKWGMSKIDPLDMLFVDEAWQLSWANFMLLSRVAQRFVLIGDPGQIPPVVTIDTSRWETAPRPPHEPAPSVLLREDRGLALTLDLPATRRLAHDSARLVRGFYDFEFDSWAREGDRRITYRRAGSGGVDRALDVFAAGSAATLLLPTPAGGPPLERDDEIAGAAVETVVRLLDREPEAEIDGDRAPVRPEDVGLCATHRVMNAAMDLKLPAALRGRVRVDTPERWQGLERKVMVVVHPLSSTLRPSAFDLETGRLCVMVSRHQAGLILVGRDHIPETLDRHLPVAEQAVGRPDAAGRGQDQNLRFWAALAEQGRVFHRDRS